MYKLFFIIPFVCSFFTLAAQSPASLKQLKKQVTEELQKEKGVFAVAFKDIGSGQTLFINEHEIFHAASTMKTPVLIEAYRQAGEGKFSLSDSVIIKNEFISIADSGTFRLHETDDSETELYKHVGEKTVVSSLVYQMIINSSNLATNIIIEKLGAKNVTATMRKLGAKDILVLRGVEDGKAYEKGMNNVVTAFDLALIFEKMAKGKTVDAGASAAMINILLDQRFNDIIPANLPPGTKVAHKTGFFTGVHHDSGIVFLPDGRKYVLVLLSKNLEDEKAAVAAMARVSEMIYNYIIKK
jgi:beta-lactamase class A